MVPPKKFHLWVLCRPILDSGMSGYMRLQAPVVGPHQIDFICLTDRCERKKGLAGQSKSIINVVGVAIKVGGADCDHTW